MSAPASTHNSTSTPLSFYSFPSKAALVEAFVGKKLGSLRTPAAIIDRKRFERNCEEVTKGAKDRGMGFRAHVKTHKTTEGTRLQVQAAGGVKGTICSTMVEVWKIIEDGLVHEGLVNDILYSMPIGSDKIADIDLAQKRIGETGIVRCMVDHPTQVQLLDQYNKKSGRTLEWSVFVKVDGGGRRAGVPPSSQQMKDLINAVIASEHVNIFGFYSHFGQSYASDSLSQSSDYFAGEIACVQQAALTARGLGAKPKDKTRWVLSVGATPTAHAAVAMKEVEAAHGGLDGDLELHAGCYCLCDLQQHATTLVPSSHLALTVLARVVSLYPTERDEAMCDAGALAVSKDTGKYPGFGRVIWPAHATGWDLGRISQEHGTLIRRKADPVGKESSVGFAESAQGDHKGEEQELAIGDVIKIVPQHACLVCANFPWFYIVDDDGDEVVDVWVPWKGW